MRLAPVTQKQKIVSSGYARQPYNTPLTKPPSTVTFCAVM